MEFNNSINRLTREEWILIEVNEFLASKKRKLMDEGERYYLVENDINKRQIFRYDESARPVVDETKVNEKLSHGFMHNLVDDKVNYLLTKPYTMTCEDKAYLENVKNVLGKRFQKRIAKLGTEASNKGTGWLYVYISSDGEFKTLMIPAEQCIPEWTDNDHEELECLIRVYDVEVYEGKEKKVKSKVEYYTPEGVTYYEKDENQLMIDAEMYLDVDDNQPNELGHFKVDDKYESWGKVPFVPFKNNDFEMPDLKFVKSLIDNYDLTRSDVSNTLAEIRSVIFALNGYDGTNLAEFMHDLSYYRAVKVDGEDGGVEPIQTEINIDAAKSHYEQLKKDIFDFGQGVDKNSDKLGNSPSGIALKFIYSGLDLKCNSLEDWFKWGFEQLMYFVNKYLEVTKQPVSSREVEITFNRDIAINESDAITDCKNSQGVISQVTIVKNHPWVEDADEEIKQLAKEQTAIEDDYAKQQGGDITDGEE
ncbi:phage portal protein [Lachnoclostridium phytofermentans]|uniref:phage portal protein n=1 Tax=Lachnoclostridium phytofermentans TaxID=66219 RepID=UPI0004974420|nr:phage portal protein [Lachnoclostridium phytofermentans]